MNRQENHTVYVKGTKVGTLEIQDVMGDELSIVNAARVSFNRESKEFSDSDARLLRYLFKHGHFSPFEMVQIKFRVECPIFVARQWIRHRLVSCNEISYRYSKYETTCYLPTQERLTYQSDINKQQSTDVQVINSELGQEIIRKTQQNCIEAYNQLLDLGIAREIARIVLPVSAMTHFIWCVNLRTLLQFINVRDVNKGAQLEISVYSDVIRDYLARNFKTVSQLIEKGDNN